MKLLHHVPTEYVGSKLDPNKINLKTRRITYPRVDDIKIGCFDTIRQEKENLLTTINQRLTAVKQGYRELKIDQIFED